MLTYQFLNTIPTALNYVQLALPKELDFDAEKIKRFCQDILKQAQGEETELSEENSVISLMLAFQILHKVSPEVILKTKKGQKFLLYSHQTEAKLRPEEIIKMFSQKALRTIKKPVETLTINLETIWQKCAEEKDDLKRIQKSMAMVKQIIKPSEAATLIGTEPPILFLLTQHLLTGLAAEIWYQKEPAGRAIKIT